MLIKKQHVFEKTSGKVVLDSPRIMMGRDLRKMMAFLHMLFSVYNNLPFTNKNDLQQTSRVCKNIYIQSIYLKWSLKL